MAIHGARLGREAIRPERYWQSNTFVAECSCTSEVMNLVLKLLRKAMFLEICR